MKMIAAGKTDVGRIRTANEDNLLVTPEQGFVAVADGMGGHDDGEVASQMVVDLLRKYYSPVDDDTSIYPPLEPEITGPMDVVLMDMALRWVSNTIYEKSREGKLPNNNSPGMGSTVVALKLSDDGKHITVGHLGDSRCYRLRDGTLEQLTLDHSMIQALATAKGLTLDSLLKEGYPNNILLQGCGLSTKEKPSVNIFDAKEDDIYLLCSDGITNEISNDTIVNILLGGFPNAQKTANRLVQAAVDAGGKDNATAIVCILKAD